MRTRTLNTILLTVVLVIISVIPALGQDPFGGGTDPFGGGKPTTPAGPSTSGTRQPIRSDHPVVLTIRDQNPTTADELMRAVEMLMDIDEPGEAEKYLKQLLATRPDVDTLVGLQRRFGTAFFMRLARYEPLLPEGKNLSLAVLDAAYSSSRDPKRLEGLVKDLSDPSLGVSRTALSELRRSGVAALPVMIRALADSSRADEHTHLREALVALGKIAVEPLIGMLESPDQNARLQAITVLGQLDARRAVLYLVGPYLSDEASPRIKQAAGKAIKQIVGAVPGRVEAEQFLFGRAQSFYEGTSPRKPESDGNVVLWHWSPEVQTSVPIRYPVSDAALVEAARTADQLYALSPDRIEYRRLFLAAILQSDKLQGGLQRPLVRGKGTAHDLASSSGVDAVIDALDFAVKTDHIPAAIGAVEVLADLGDSSLLYLKGSRPGPVTELLRHRDRRLQFAAAKAILKWDPQRTYPGAGNLIDVLRHFSATLGQPRVVIGHAQTGPAQNLIGVFAENGLEGETTSNGRDLFRRAVSNPDVEVVLISDSVDYPESNQLLQMLRKDPRSANLPIALLVREENLRRAERIANLDDLTSAFVWPTSDAETAIIRERLIQMAGTRFVGRDERVNQAFDALSALVTIAASRNKYSFYDVLHADDAAIQAFQIPALSPTAAHLLGLLATPKAQLALVDFASQNARELKQRQVAAAAFRTAVKKRRLLLTTPQISRQYDRYNASEHLDRETQQLLGSILDTIERKGLDDEKRTDSKVGADKAAGSTS